LLLSLLLQLLLSLLLLPLLPLQLRRRRGRQLLLLQAQHLRRYQLFRQGIQ
jgi:hypothetical protein